MRWPGESLTVQQLVEAHYQSLYRFAFRLAGCAHEAEDLTQETFCLAQTNLRQLREPAKARSWLFTILRRAYLHRQRQKKVNSLEMDELGEVPDRSAEENLEVDPDRLQQILQELPEVYRTPVILYFFEEFSYREMAEQLQVPLGTVMSRLARAKAYLRERLGSSLMAERKEEGNGLP